MQGIIESELVNCPECFREHDGECGAFCSDACESTFHARSLEDCGVTNCGNPECDFCNRKLPREEWLVSDEREVAA